MEESQKEIALRLFNELEKNPVVVNQGETVKFEDFDKLRIQVIGKLRPLINQFLGGGIALEDFKTAVDSTNKINPLWGFRGMNGQMFFNMLYNSANNKEKLAEILLQEQDIKNPPYYIYLLCRVLMEQKCPNQRIMPSFLKKIVNQ